MTHSAKSSDASSEALGVTLVAPLAGDNASYPSTRIPHVSTPSRDQMYMRMMYCLAGDLAVIYAYVEALDHLVDAKDFFA